MSLFRMVESIASALSIERIIQSRYQSIQEVISTQFGIFLANYNTTYYIYQYILRSTTIAQATLSMRVDETLKKSFDSICDDFGFTSTAAITVFMKTVVRERRIPFEIKASTKEQINKDALAAFLEMRAAAAEAGIQDMSPEEINAEIQKTRNGR